ncbi:MAG TPA: rhomboid family intramembrane serine protease [Actinomycetota bacterium]|nr:rhomboid family intramembrane serine protease [Actinomycetota bacterium]
MTPAAVGFQCPDCVAAGRAATKAQVSTQASGRPFVTYALAGICVAVYLIGLLAGQDDRMILDYALHPNSVAYDDEWYRLMTAVFLHASLLHILFNMYVLVVLGPTLERILGHGRYLVLFLLAGLGGSVASFAFSAPTTRSVGASGAIFGLMGALLVAGRRLKYDVTQVAVLIGINIVIGFLPGAGVDWRAHLGGLVTGAAAAAVMIMPDGRRKVGMEILGLVVIVAAVTAVAAWRSAQFPVIGI